MEDSKPTSTITPSLPSSSSSSSSDPIKTQLILLQREYDRLHRDFRNLEQKYNAEVSVSCDRMTSPATTTTVVKGLPTQLAQTVESLYGQNLYTDISIKLVSRTIRAHKMILHARSKHWHSQEGEEEQHLDSVHELDWSYMREEVANGLLQWLYTDRIDFHNDNDDNENNDNDLLALNLLEMAHRFHLSQLSAICERYLISTANIQNCVHYYCKAEKVHAQTLLNYCSELISVYWNELKPQDFTDMSQSLLYTMLHQKTKYPLHAAIRLLREDVVRQYLEENQDQLQDLSNSLSDQGLLPLQVALISQQKTIALLLIQNGKANLNAYDLQGSTLLIDAVKRCDVFSVEFLLEHNCDVNLKAQSNNNTALHVICGYVNNSPKGRSGEVEEEEEEEREKIGKALLQKHANVNLQNNRGETPLHLAIKYKNQRLIELLLNSCPSIDVNLRTNDEQCALELCLLQSDDFFRELAAKLLKCGANSNPLRIQTNDNLLQILIQKEMEESALLLLRLAATKIPMNHVNHKGYTALHLAAERNMFHLVEELLEMDAKPNEMAMASNWNTPLHLAVESNASEVINVFIKRMKETERCLLSAEDLNCKNIDGKTPLHLCLELGRQQLLNAFVVEMGADINLRNDAGFTLLHQAILKRDVEAAVFLLQQEADMYALTSTPESKNPLQLAIEQRLSKVVDVLCSRGVSLSVSEGQDPPLWLALELDFEDIAQILVRHGVDTDCWSPGPEGCQQTLLHRAIDENKEAAAIFLIRSKCDLDSPRQPGPNGEGGDEVKDKSSPLHLCCLWGLVEVLKTLIGHGANVNALDAENATPLHVAIRNRQEEIITILLCHPNIDLRLRDKSGDTAFAVALKLRNHKIAQRILNYLPCAAEQMDSRGRNFLHLAIQSDDLESVLFLLSIQVDVNSRVHDASQATPMHLAVLSKNEMIVRNLILAEARLNERDAQQKTPLHVAAERGNLCTLSILLQNGIDYDALDGEGNNALHIAVRGGHLAIVRELLLESRINAEAINLKGRNPLHELCRYGEDNNAAMIFSLFIESMPKYPLNATDLDGNTPLILAFTRGQAPLCRVLVKHGACLGTENRDGISIFNYKLATNQLLHKLLDHLPQESPWSESDLCQECSNKFSLTMRKHHCRHCGRVICSKCSNHDVPILKFGITKPVRVCGICFDVLQGFHGNTNNSNNNNNNSY